MIKLDVISNCHQHSMIMSDEPCRIETSVQNGKVSVMVYKGTEIDFRQDPVAVFDGDINNKDILVN